MPSVNRDSALAHALGRAWGKGNLHAEQLAFALSLQPEVMRSKPDVIYFSEWYTGVGLDLLRKVNRQQYALVLSNGSMGDVGFQHFDRVHQHTAPALEHVLKKGADPRRHILLPVAFRMQPVADVPGADELQALRERHGLPTDRPVVISVAALNRWHKRLDYLITEVARIPEPRPYVLLVGQPEAETEGLRALGSEALGDDGHSFRSVPRAEIDELLRASDFFVLASLGEGLPRALIEALASGLPCLAHDYPVGRYALGDFGHFADFTQPGALAGLLQSGIVRDGGKAREQHRSVYERFSWDHLKPQYVDMLAGAAGRAPFG